MSTKSPKAKGHLNIVLKINRIYIKQNHALGASARFPPSFSGGGLSTSTVTIGVLKIGARGGLTAGWARTTPLSSLGGSYDLGVSSLSSVTTFLIGVIGSDASIEISDKSSFGKADATCLRQSSNPVP